VAQGQSGQWPQVQAGDWCGQWLTITATVTKDEEVRKLEEALLAIAFFDRDVYTTEAEMISFMRNTAMAAAQERQLI
jgi:hypothetical protein